MIVMQFMGGLGNQIFQYALYRSLVQSGKRVILDNTFFVQKPWAYAIDIFPNIKIKKFKRFRNYLYYKGMRILRRISSGVHLNYSENLQKAFDDEIFEKDNCYISGFFQNEYYFKAISDELREELTFPIGEEKLQMFINHVEQEDYVSIHIRRTDYLEFKEVYGNICDDIYYHKALEWVFNKKSSLKCLVFSDDIEWVKENMEIPNALYVTSSLFEHYEDWYDMCLMSHCKHNIIANSTFSWWGAWLNNHKNKIVICPKRWDNLYPHRGLACESWISI